MFTQQQQPQGRKGHVVAPAVASHNEQQAAEKLAGYVYEYLMQTGAMKTAEAFKSETQHNLSQIAPGEAPGFLQSWWNVFWDLYAAAPERREKYGQSTIEAKLFHDNFIASGAYPGAPGHAQMMNGMHGVPPQFMNGPHPGMNAEGMMPNFFAGGPRGQPQPGPSVHSNQASPGYPANNFPPGAPRYHPAGARSGAPTPSGMGPVFPPGSQQPPPQHMFNEQQLRNMTTQRLPPPNNPAAVRMPTNFPQNAAMRQMRPGAYPNQFESQAGTPPFNSMMSNGNMMAASMMTSPGPGGPPPMNEQDPRFMSMVNQFPMSHPLHAQHDGGAGTPQGLNGGMQHQPNMENPNQLQNLLNGGDGPEMKQSPASVHGGTMVNGGSGTPGTSHPNPGSIGGGPSSGGHGPSSVHSQSGAGPNSQHPQQPQQQRQTPGEQAPSADSFQTTGQQQANANGDEAAEISKIKASLFDDCSTFT